MSVIYYFSITVQYTVK